MNKLLLIVLLAGSVSLLPAQDQAAGAPPDLQAELKSLHSTLRALKRSQAAQKKTFNILAARIDSLQGAVGATHREALQAIDSAAQVSKAQAEHSLRVDALENTLDTRTALLILALVALGGLSLVIFFTLKKAIVEASRIVMEQAQRPTTFEAKRHESKAVSALTAESPQKRTAITLPIEPELFEAASQQAAAGDTTAASAPELHKAIAQMIAPPERGEQSAVHASHAPVQQKHTARVKTAGHCQGVTKAGSQCKRKALPGTHFCSQHTK